MTGCTCGCCTGVEALTPLSTFNRAGLDALSYRVGTYATLLETMQARLSAAGLPELKGLTTRRPDDPSMALLDAWAVVGDILTFYQERIANEGYLRTATERRSILELARLVGYNLRPGVAASVFLAFTMEQGQKADIPAGARSQSVPGPGELPQSFETSEAIAVRAEWNVLKPRVTRPQVITARTDGNVVASIDTDTVYFEGTSTNLRVGDPLLFAFGVATAVRHVERVEPQLAQGRTKVTLQEKPPDGGQPGNPIKRKPPTAADTLDAISRPLARPPADHPANRFRLARDLSETLSAGGDLLPQMLSVFDRSLDERLYAAWGRTTLTPPQTKGVEIYALRTTASLFAHNLVLQDDEPDPSPEGDEQPGVLFLDNAYRQILPGSFIVVQRPDDIDPNRPTPRIFTIDSVLTRSRTAYGITADTTRILLANQETWWRPTQSPAGNPDPAAPFSAIRGTVVYAQSERLALAEAPIDVVTEPVSGDHVELADLFGGLPAGRWMIVTGERTDVLGASGEVVPGIDGAELVMLSGVTQDAGETPGSRIHTTLHFSHDLSFKYKRDTVVIYGNVVDATHGETRAEVLGSGNAADALQQFALRQSPLTFVSAPTVTGCASTLQVRIDDVRWHEADSLNVLSEKSRGYITRTDDDGKTIVVTGDGVHGARPPSGSENVKAIYRTGIGAPGNVKAGDIRLVVTRPLGLKSVTNPIASSGGADPESRDAARRNAPLALMALDRLVSVIDYEHFARTFAGVGKAQATQVASHRRAGIHLTIAGDNDAPIEPTSDLMTNLDAAFRLYGDVAEPVEIRKRALLLLVISARVRVATDYLWELVEPHVRRALLAAFGFDRRDLGQPVFLSEVIAAIQKVRGVAAVDVNVLDSVAEDLVTRPAKLAETLKKLVDDATAPGFVPKTFVLALPARPRPDPKPGEAAVSDSKREETDTPDVLPAQLAILSPRLPATLILTEWTT